MDQTTLKYLRILIPGMMFFLGIFPIINFFSKTSYDIKSLNFTYVTAFSILLGAIYDQTNLRYLIVKISGYYIDSAIFDALIKIYKKEINTSQEEVLKSNKKYMHVFYKVIDNDESLKKKTNNVYFNGIFWTSSADLLLLSFSFWFVYKYWFIQIDNAALYSNLMLILFGSAMYLHVLSAWKHIRLSNEQLQFISIYKETDVINDFDKILQCLPPANNQEGQS